MQKLIATPEISRLWFEVIMQGFKDVLSGSDDARKWLYTNDFETCCDLAGVDNSERLRDIIESASRQNKPTASNPQIA